MTRSLRIWFFAAALLFPAFAIASLISTRPAMAQDADGFAVGFQAFHDRLAPYGSWHETKRWGDVWQPGAVSPDFRPYYDGHWIYTDAYGWYWVSDEPWADIVYHYGRWVYDPDDGWLWIPGYVWAPAWVVWRDGDGITGWMPMPPDEASDAGNESYPADWSGAADNYYGYGQWFGQGIAPTFFSLWVFVNDDHFCDRDFRRFAFHDGDGQSLFWRTRDKTRYSVEHGFVVNHAVSPNTLFLRTGTRIAPVRLSAIQHRDWARPMRADLGLSVGRRERDARPDAAQPDRAPRRVGPDEYGNAAPMWHGAAPTPPHEDAAYAHIRHGGTAVATPPWRRAVFGRPADRQPPNRIESPVGVAGERGSRYGQSAMSWRTVRNATAATPPARPAFTARPSERFKSAMYPARPWHAASAPPRDATAHLKYRR